ncbi:MAG: hypothetical protein ABIZ57_02625 [Candidatus Limnocylindria bacterium]
MTPLLRLLALIGSVAHGVDRLAGRLLGFLPFRVPGALLLAALLGLGTWNAVVETGRAIAARPIPLETSVNALVAESNTAWVSVSGLLSGPHLDNSIYASDTRPHYLRISDDPHDHVIEGPGESLMPPGPRQTIFPLTTGDGVTRWFYVLRDAGSADRALVIRSARDANEIRARSVTVVRDGMIDGLPHLVEIADAEAEPATASVARVEDGARSTIRGTFESDATEVACDGGDACHEGRSWRYRVTDLADPDASAWLDSPHPPDALPVTLNGVVTTDATRMRAVLAEDAMTAALDGLTHPDDVVLADGIGPAVPEVTYLGAVILAALACILLLSAVIRYPIFQREAGRGARNLPRPVVGELIPLDVSGELPGVSGAERPAGAPARIGWLPAREMARQAWHLRSELSDAGSGQARLALVAIEGGFVLPLEPIRDRLRVEPGLVATTSTVRPGLRLTAPDLRLMLGFASAIDRDRVERELAPAMTAPAVGPIPDSVHPRPRVQRPWARAATVAGLSFTAALVVTGAGFDLLLDEAAPVGIGVALLVVASIGLLTIGIARRRALADELLPSAALLGLVIAGVMAVAVPGCGTWLTPNIADCAGIDVFALVTALTAVVTFAFSLWAVPHLVATAEPV